MKFVCEKCGKSFNTEQECVEHETKQKVEREERQKSLDNVRSLYKIYEDALKIHNEKFTTDSYLHDMVMDLFNCNSFDEWYNKNWRDL